MKRIGFIGLGIMGKPMARNLLKQYPLVAYDIVPAAMEASWGPGQGGDIEPRRGGAKRHRLTDAPELPEVKQAVLGQGGVLGGPAGVDPRRHELPSLLSRAGEIAEKARERARHRRRDETLMEPAFSVHTRAAIAHTSAFCTK